MPTPTPRQPQPAPLPPGSPRHARTAAEPTASAPDNSSPPVLQQRLQGAFLTIIGLAGLIGGVLFSIEAPRFTPVPVVFLTFWLVMVIVGKILFAGLSKLRDAGVGAPAPQQVRAAAAVAGIVVAVGMMGFAATSAGSGVAAAAPCPGGGPATCGPTGPDLTFTPPPAQTGAPGGQQGQQGGQDQQGIATSPAKGGDNGPGIQAQTPEFGTPGQQAPNIPGNEQPGQGGGQQGQQPQGNGQGQQNQSPVQTTAPGRPDQTGQQQTGQTNSGQPSSPTVTVTKTESQCAVPGAGNGAGTPGGPGSGDSNNNGSGTGPDDGDGQQEDGAPSWAYLVGEVSALMTGRRGRKAGPLNPDGSAPTNDMVPNDQVDGENYKEWTTPDGKRTFILSENADAPSQYRFNINEVDRPDGGSVDVNDDGSLSTYDRDGNEINRFTPWAYDTKTGEKIPTNYTRDGDDLIQTINRPEGNNNPILADPPGDDLAQTMAILQGGAVPPTGPYTPQQEAARTAAAQATQQQAATQKLTGPMRDAIAQAQGQANPTPSPLDSVLQATGKTKSTSPIAPLEAVAARVQDPDTPTDPLAQILAEKERIEAPALLQQAREAEQARQRRIADAPAAWDKFFGSDAAGLRDYFLDDVYPVGENTVADGRNYIKYVTMSDGSQLVIRGRDGVNPFTDTTLSKVQVTGSPILGDADLDVPNGKASPTPGALETLLEATDAASWAAVVVPGGGAGRAGVAAASKAAQRAFVHTLEKKIAEGATAAVAKREAQEAARQAAKEALEHAEKRAARAAQQTASTATRDSVKRKLDGYLLAPDHPVGGPKAKWFEQALGFTRENAAALESQIVFDSTKALPTKLTQYGQQYNQVIPITGANGKIIDVTFGWIRNDDGIVRLVTAIPTKR